MRMVLQSAFTDLFLVRNNGWTRTLADARVFEEWLDAYEFTLEEALVDTYIVPLPTGEMAECIAEPSELSELELK